MLNAGRIKQALHGNRHLAGVDRGRLPDREYDSTILLFANA